MMKKLLFSVLIAASVVSVSCTKRVEGILREEPAEISKKEAVKIRSYYEDGGVCAVSARTKGGSGAPRPRWAT